MQRIFVYEYISGGGTLAAEGSQAPSGSMLREGGGMAAALAADFLQVPRTKVTLLRDARLRDLVLPVCRQVAIHDADGERRAIERCSREADQTVVIAPETNNALTDRVRWVESVGGRLLSPSSEFVACAANKNMIARLLCEAGVPVPDGRAIRVGDALPGEFGYPAVLKPVDGAGSVGVQRIESADAPYEASELGQVARLESYRQGFAASVAVLCGPAGNTALPACGQTISNDGRFRYLGGEVPLDETRSQRAQSLALAALACLPATVGYVGVDLVLGTASDGSEDTVIEVNPRLTTSYLALRRLLHTNLAAAMQLAANGDEIELSFARSHVRFDI